MIYFFPQIAALTVVLFRALDLTARWAFNFEIYLLIVLILLMLLFVYTFKNAMRLLIVIFFCCPYQVRKLLNITILCHRCLYFACGNLVVLFCVFKLFGFLNMLGLEFLPAPGDAY